VTYYIEFILLVPVLLWAYKGRNVVRDAVVTIGIGILVTLIVLPFPVGIIRNLLSCLYPLRSACVGIFIAKYALFDKIHTRIGRKSPFWFVLLSFCFICICINILSIINPSGGVKWVTFSGYVGFLLKVLLMGVVLEMLLRIRSNRFKQVLCVLGKYSFCLWLLHGIFFTGKHFLQVELYSLQEPILILAVCIVALLPIAYVIDKFVSFIFGLITQRMGKS
jgi:peptidoglycan/LPS O-acetylase OafA/YrhL